jgi:hypothetical protein
MLFLRNLTTCWRTPAIRLSFAHRRRRAGVSRFHPRRDRSSATASPPLDGETEASNPHRFARPGAPLPPRPAHLLRYGPLPSPLQFPLRMRTPAPWWSDPTPVSRLHPWAPAEKGVCLSPPTALKRPDRLVLGPAAGQGRPDRLQCQGYSSRFGKLRSCWI